MNKIQKVEIFEAIPEGFSTRIQVAACYLEIDGKLLLLQRATDKSEPSTWGVPAGKLESGETAMNAAKRELFEETAISLQDSQIQSLDQLYIRKPHMEYVYHLFNIQLDQFPTIQLSPENQAYKWATPEDFETLPLIGGAKAALHHYRLKKNLLKK